MATVVVLAISCLGLWLRIFHLGYKSLWLDEAVIWLIQLSTNMASVVANNAHFSSGPPGFVILLHVVGQVDQSEVALRLIPMLAGVVAIPCIYALSSALFPSKLGAACAALFVAVAPLQVVYSQQAREYSLTFLLACLILLLAVRYATGPTTRRLIALTIAEAAAILTQYGLITVVTTAILSTAFIVLWDHTARTRRNVVAWVASQVVLVLIALTVYSTTTRYQLRPGGFAADSYLGQAYWDGMSIGSLLHFLGGSTWGLLSYAFTYDSLAALVLLLLAGGLYALARSPQWRLIAAFLAGPVIFTMALALLRLYPYAPARQDMYLTVPIYLLMGWGVATIFAQIRRWPILPMGAGAALIVLLVPPVEHSWNYLYSTGTEQAGPVIQSLYGDAQMGDGIYTSFDGRAAFIYYWCRLTNCDDWMGTRHGALFPRSVYTDYYGRQIVLGLNGAPGDRYHKFSELQLRYLLSQHTIVWLFFSHSAGEITPVLNFARQYGRIDFAHRNSGVVLYRFVRQSPSGIIFTRSMMRKAGVPFDPTKPVLSLISGPQTPLGQEAIYGEGYKPRERVSLRYFCTFRSCDGRTLPLGVAMTDKTGSFSVTVSIPTFSGRTAHVLGATGETSGRFAVVVHPPMVQLARLNLRLGVASAQAGSLVPIAGSGFGPWETVEFRYFCSLSACSSGTALLGKVKTDGSGAFSTTVRIPTYTPAGHHVLAALGLSTKRFIGRVQSVVG